MSLYKIRLTDFINSVNFVVAESVSVVLEDWVPGKEYDTRNLLVYPKSGIFGRQNASLICSLQYIHTVANDGNFTIFLEKNCIDNVIFDNIQQYLETLKV